MAKRAHKGGGSLKLYKSYSFKDKDPVIDRLRTIIQDEGTTYATIHEDSGVSVTTLYNWFSGTTLRPQYASVMAVVRAMGYDMQIVKADTTARSKIVILEKKRKVG